MKRISLALMFVMLFAVCAFAAQPMRLTLATGGTAGTYYPYGGALAQIISDKSGVVSITAQSTGATGENLNLIGMGDVDLALVQNDLSHYAYNGIELFKDNKINNFRAIARLYPEIVHVVAQGGGAIKSMPELAGKKVSVGASGSGNEANCRQIFEFFNLSYQNTTPLFISYAETVNHFKDRQCDAFVFTTGVPNPGILDITTMHDTAFLPIDGMLRDEIIKKYPYFAPAIIPANSYRGQTQDVPTIAVQAILIASEDLPADIVYAMTKAMFENLDEIGRAHAKGKELLLKEALFGLTVPLHPGAERYYKEVGAIN